MATIYSGKIDVKKIPKDKLFVGEKGTYLGLTITVNDTPDNYGNVVSVSVEQTKEEREQKAPKVFLGNCKLIWSSEPPKAQPAVQAPYEPLDQMPKIDEDLPF